MCGPSSKCSMGGVIFIYLFGCAGSLLWHAGSFSGGLCSHFVLEELHMLWELASASYFRNHQKASKTHNEKIAMPCFVCC